MAGPWDALLAFHDLYVRLGPAGNNNEVSKARQRIRGQLGCQKRPQFAWARDGCRQANTKEISAETAQPRHIKGEKIAAFGRAESMQLIDNQSIEIGEQVGSVRMAEHESELLGRGQQNIRRFRSLAGTPGHRRITGAYFAFYFEAHILDWRG